MIGRVADRILREQEEERLVGKIFPVNRAQETIGRRRRSFVAQLGLVETSSTEAVCRIAGRTIEHEGSPTLVGRADIRDGRRKVAPRGKEAEIQGSPGQTLARQG